MNRIDFIDEYSKQDRIGDNSILYALIRCLDANETIELLLYSLPKNLLLRQATLKIVTEQAAKKWLNIHDILIENIIKIFPKLPSNRRSSVFTSLGVLANFAPEYIRKIIIHFLLTSKYTSGRRKGLKILKKEEIILFKREIELCAWKFNEVQACMILINHMPEEYLFNNIKKLGKILIENWQLGRLYLKASAYDQSCLKDLYNIDNITYAYVVTKLNLKIPEKDLLNIINKNCQDERLGLLIWATGKMQYWDIVLYISKHYENWQKEKMLNQ